MATQTNISSPLPCQFVFSDTLLGVWLILNLLLLPLFLFVLYVGFTRTKKPSVWSHSDVFTFNIIPMEVLSITGNVIIADQAWVQSGVGNYLRSIATSGQMFVHTYTCVDRYLAVVHPITYLRLKKRGGVRMRNISIAAAWILSVGLKSLFKVVNIEYGVLFNIIIVFTFFGIVAFCSISVLCALIRPGPGDGRRAVKSIDQSKRRAFVIIILIIGVLLMRIVAFNAQYLVSTKQLLDNRYYCLLSFSLALFFLPSSLILPLTFLQKFRKLPKCSI